MIQNLFEMNNIEKRTSEILINMSLNQSLKDIQKCICLRVIQDQEKNNISFKNLNTRHIFNERN